MPDRREPDGELPPDPWAGQTGPPPPPRPDRSSPLGHPAIWVGVTVLAVLALLAAVLDAG